MNERHIPDDRLIDLCTAAPAAAGEQAHLAVCLRCESRRVEIVGILAELDDAATSEANTVFPDDKLERQHARILQRVEQDGRPGRLVAFPAHQPSTTFLSPTRPRVRWAAAVAAAAFVAGVLTGQWTHTFTNRLDAVAEAELARQMHHEPPRRELIIRFLDRGDQSAAVTAGEDVRDFVLEIEALLENERRH